jgi:hypothetical protein
MALAKIAWTWPLFALLPVLAVGCGGSSAPAPRPRQDIELQQIYDMYKHFMKSHEQKPPRQLSDIANKQYEGISPTAVQALKQERYLVVWGVDISTNDSTKVLAYEKDAPTKGGKVLMADGTVQEMSADQLQAALPKKG